MVKTAIENEQNLIVEGCYIPFDWRRGFDARYLTSIRFMCLAMTDAYIDAHFAEIKDHSSDIKARLEDAWCTADKLKKENREIIKRFQKTGEHIVLIDGDYEQTLRMLFA